MDNHVRAGIGGHGGDELILEGSVDVQLHGDVPGVRLVELLHKLYDELSVVACEAVPEGDRDRAFRRCRHGNTADAHDQCEE